MVNWEGNFKEAFYLQKPKVHFSCDHYLHGKKKKTTTKQNTKPDKPHPFFHVIILYTNISLNLEKCQKKNKNSSRYSSKYLC